MHKEQVIQKMQKPARILKVVCKIIFICTIISIIISAIMMAALPSLTDFILETLDSPGVEQTAETRELIGMFKEWRVTLDSPFWMVALVNFTASLVLSAIAWRTAGKLFESISEERYSLLRPEYAKGVHKIAILHLIMAGINLLASVILSVTSIADSSLVSDFSSANDGSLMIGLILLGIAAIYRHACTLQLINENENFEPLDDYMNDNKKQEDTTFDGF